MKMQEKEMKKRSKNNRGMALVSVLIVITLIGLLASSILRLSYLAYARKLVEKRNTENFYAAESVIDTVKTVLQNSAASALSAAEDGTLEFALAAYKAITGEDSFGVGWMAPAATTAAVRDKIYAKIGGVDSIGTSIQAAITPIDEGGLGGEFTIGDILLEETGVRIVDVHVVYVNNEGYTAEILTDIVINAPIYAMDETVPVGTYSMFAGNGASMESAGSVDYQRGNHKASFGNMSYLHQEGNAYVGAQMSGNTMTTTALELSGNKGSSIMSFGGTNIVINGDLIIDRANTVAFTGGDGTKPANIQVNGYIVLKNGGTLLLAPNCNVVCKGIVTSITYDGAGNASYTAYTGAGAENSISVFYPFTQSLVSGTTHYLNDYLNNKIDVEQVLDRVHVFTDQDFANIDLRYRNVMEDSPTGGVYMLNTAYNATDGWQRRQTDAYYLLTCTKVGSVWNWSCASGAISNVNINCREDDEKLQQIAKVYFNGKYYDKEFADIINIQLHSKFTELINMNNKLSNYSSADNSTFKKVTWNELAPAYVRNMYGTLNPTLQAMTPLYEEVFPTTPWSAGWDSMFYWEQIYGNGWSTRPFYLPNSTAQTGMTYTSISSSEGTFTPRADQTVLNNTNGVVNGGTDLIYLYISNNAFTVHITGDYAGIFMSAEHVEIGHCTGGVRGISLIELAEVTTTNPGIQNENNPVRQFLQQVGSGLVTVKNQTGSIFTNDAFYVEFAIADNIFNGGVSVFWDRANTNPPPQSPSDQDNSATNFVDSENWQRD